MAEKYFSKQNVVDGVSRLSELTLPLPVNVALGIENWRHGVQWDSWRTSNRRHKSFNEWDDVFVANLKGDTFENMGTRIDYPSYGFSIKDPVCDFFHCFEVERTSDSGNGKRALPEPETPDILDSDQEIKTWLWLMYPQYMKQEPAPITQTNDVFRTQLSTRRFNTARARSAERMIMKDLAQDE